MANRRACSADVPHIGVNAYTLSGQGLVSRMVASYAAAVGVPDPNAVDVAELDFWGHGHRHATKAPFSGRPSRA
jgi:hypothetical protein